MFTALIYPSDTKQSYEGTAKVILPLPSGHILLPKIRSISYTEPIRFQNESRINSGVIADIILFLNCNFPVRTLLHNSVLTGKLQRSYSVLRENPPEFL